MVAASLGVLEEVGLARVPRTLSKKERRRLRLARDWMLEKEGRYYAHALRRVGLGIEFKAYLRVLREAERRVISINVSRETPRFMYALVFWEAELLKVGVALRANRPRRAVAARLAEHARTLGEQAGEWFWWPGSLEAENRLLRKLGQPINGREWFKLTKARLKRVENVSRMRFSVRGAG